MHPLPFLFFSEILRLLQIGFGVVILFSLSEIIRRKFALPAEFTRKFVHLTVGIFVFFSPMIFLRKNPVLLISGLFTLVDLAAYRLGVLPSVHGTERRSYGTAYYPMAFFILTFFLWDLAPAIVVAGMMVMVLGDAAAGITGEFMAKPHEYHLSRDKKSIEGSAMMFLVSFLALGGTSLFYNGKALGLTIPGEVSFPLVLLLFACISLFATAWEAISARGLDNLTAPLAAAFALYFSIFPGSGGSVERFILGSGFAALVALLSFRFRFLAPSGSVATFLLATLIFSVGGWSWSIPILTFFLFSSLLSRLGGRGKKAAAEISRKGEVRDFVQVAANGGVPGLIILAAFFFPHPLWFFAYLGAVAAVAADTWSSEIGLMSGTDPRNILNGRREAPGTSGAISMLGLLGGIGGAATIGFSALPFRPAGMGFPPALAACLAGGLAGTIADSILGASLQVQFRCVVCEKITEKRLHCGADTLHVKGLAWLDNDLVNVFCSLAGLAAGWGIGRLF